MKKFTKICLATALATFLIGCLLGCAGTLLGGLRQLEHASVRQLTGIPFRFVRNGTSAFFGFWDGRWDDDWEEYWEWDSSEGKPVEESDYLDNKEESGVKEDEAGKEKTDAQNQTELKGKDVRSDDYTSAITGGMETGLTANGLRGLDIEVGACQMYIGEGADDQLSIAITGECENHYRYRIKDGNTFMLVHEDMKSGSIDDIWNRNHPKGNTKIVLYLPKDASLDEINIDFGAGKLETGYLKAKKIELNVGAGDCRSEGIEASESVDISLGAGKIVASALTAREAEFDIAAGELQINDAEVSHETKVEISMGNAILNGVFTGELEAECSMGNLDFTLEGSESDYNYEVDCGMGSVKIGGKSYNSLSDQKIYNDSNNIIDITCSMGSVNVDFTR